MTTARHFSLTENARHSGSLGIVAAGALALMLGGLTACGQGGQQGQGNQQDQMQGWTGQQGQGGEQQRRKQDGR